MTLLTFIKKNKNLRKLFGKRELVIIQKQLLGVRLTQSERNRLSRDIRKKLEVIKEIAQFSPEFGLKHGIEVKRIITETMGVISNSTYRPRIKRVFLFGSTADATRTLQSDIDIAVEFESITKDETVRFRLDILRKANDLVDIQVYNVLPDKLKKEIDLRGRSLAL